MSILVSEKTRLIVQGITGRQGLLHAQGCRDYGTRVVGGVTPAKGGTSVDGFPVFNTVAEAVRETGANTSIVFVPAAFAADAIFEAADAGIPLVVCITEGVPTADMVALKRYLRGSKTRLVGPNCPGVISPGKAKVGIMPGYVFKQGQVGVVSRSGTLTYEAAAQLTAAGVGQSTCVGLGGDPIVGTPMVEALGLFQKDPETEAVVLIGEIGGTMEQEAAEDLRKKMTKPVVAFIAGSTAPPGRRMGHAGAIITGKAGTAQSKQEELAQAGATIVESPAAIGATMKSVLARRKP